MFDASKTPTCWMKWTKSEDKVGIVKCYGDKCKSRTGCSRTSRLSVHISSSTGGQQNGAITAIDYHNKKSDPAVKEQKSLWQKYRESSANLYPTSSFAIEERVRESWNYYCDTVQA